MQQMQAIGFKNAVKLAFSRCTDFIGRAGRAEYWWFTLFSLTIYCVIGVILPNLLWIWCLTILLPSLSLAVRRLHDTGRRGWYLLWLLLPLMGIMMVLLQTIKDSAPDNQWGPSRKA